ncbi:hypothetical protein O181_068851 [Austropuccinia psidii MF-1]|uniref:Uncharacterized protein n=1 Tax=Austropuccinia psidii MF-1 TaxID=1389203 RepID=A0A9Q3I4A0_9BASI|nr:hypothetical protein [Austropuccinia psidii MF-1]
MEEPYSFYGAKAHQLTGFIQSCQVIFHIDPANFFSDRKKVLYSNYLLTGKVEKWIELYPSNISHEKPSYVLNNSKLFATQLLTLFGDPNEKFNVQNWRLEKWAYIHVYRRGLASGLLDQLASHPSTFDNLKKLIDIILELDTRYHEREKEKGGNQEKKPPVSGSNSSRPPQGSYSKRLHQKNKNGKQSQVAKNKPHAALLNKDSKLIGCEKKRRLEECLLAYCGGKHQIEKCYKRSQNKPGSSGGLPIKKGKDLV